MTPTSKAAKWRKKIYEYQKKRTPCLKCSKPCDASLDLCNNCRKAEKKEVMDPVVERTVERDVETGRYVRCRCGATYNPKTNDCPICDPKLLIRRR